MVLDWTGLARGGDTGSSSLLLGADAALLELERWPIWILADAGSAAEEARAADGRPILCLAAGPSRPLGVRARGPVVLGTADEACRACLVGIGGGAMEGRAAEIDGRERVPGTGLAFEGVVVRDGAPLEGAVPSCLVGDRVGDLIPLSVRDWGL
jgi:hypothetical protein